MSGIASVLVALRSVNLTGMQLEAHLGVIEKAEEEDSRLLLHIDAVDLLCTKGLGSADYAPVGIAALGQVLEFLIQDASSGTLSGDVQQYEQAIEKGVGAIITRLQAEVKGVEIGGKPFVKVYSQAMVALRNVSWRSDRLGARIAASPTVKAAVDTALDRDYWRLNFDALEQLVAALSFFSGLPTVLQFLEQYSTAPRLHESACKVVVADAEHQDGATTDGTIMHSASRLAFWASLDHQHGAE